MRRIIDAAKYEDHRALSMSALGKAPCDLAIINARVVDTLNETTERGEIFIKNGIIVHVERDPGIFGQFEATEVYDAKGAYAAPGLMDSHVHIESSMLSPYHFGRAIARHGTTAVFTDPHEIANVVGQDGIRYMYENSLADPVVRQFILIPSCVPAVPSLESAGAAFFGKDVEELADRYPDAVRGLAEVMDYIGVINADPRMTDIINAARRKDLYIQSHYSGLAGRDLSAYLAAGMGGNHESYTADEVVATLKSGGWIDMRGSSSILDGLDRLLPAILSFPNPGALRVTFCTDDVHAADLIDKEHGHVNKIVKRAIDYGLKPETALAYATRNVAAEYGIENLGAIAPGYLADMIIFDSFESLEPVAVFVGGRLVAERGKLPAPAKPELGRPARELEEVICSTMNLAEIDAGSLAPRVTNRSGEVMVNVLVFDGHLTKLGQEAITVTNGALDISGRPDLCYVAVLNRYGAGNSAIGVLKGFGLTKGAAATTVSHDSHNLTLIYKDPVLAAEVGNRLIACGGGLAAAENSGQIKLVELPIGGLMSTLSAEELTPVIHAFEQALPALFGGIPTPLLKLVVLTLPVIPEIRVTDLGIVNTISQEFIPLIP